MSFPVENELHLGCYLREWTVRFRLYIVIFALLLALPAVAEIMPDTNLVEGKFEHNPALATRRPEPVRETIVVDGEEVSVRKYVFNASREAFLNMDTSSRASLLFYWNAEGVAKYPIETVVDFYACWSSADSDPECRVEFLDEGNKPIMAGDAAISVRKMSRDQRRAWINTQLGESIDSVKSIHMYKDEKMDLLWGLFGGIMGGSFTALAAMIAEFPIAYAMDKEYDWKDVGWITLAGFVGFTSYSVIHIAVTRDTKRLDVTIRF